MWIRFKEIWMVAILLVGGATANDVHTHYFSNGGGGGGGGGVGDAVVYHPFPHFWTGVGFCPAGDINHAAISSSLFSPSMVMNLRQVAALPAGAITHIRIHWLLELIEFMEYAQSGVPIYDFGTFDRFIDLLQELELSPVLEFMANPGNVFIQNPNMNSFLWEDFVKQIIKHHIARHGAAQLANWRFETWNEPDIRNYNRLNFTADSYLEYVEAIRRGLSKGGGGQRRRRKQRYRALRGPAGLFKSHERHPLCWRLLEICDTELSQCPIDILTFHRKGDEHGTAADEIVNGTLQLLTEIYEDYPNLKQLPVANDEADPVSSWSTPRDFQADVRYAITLMSTVVLHWHEKLSTAGVLHNLESISHDNAFLSYHPYEFTQRTLLAHFRMNETQPPHSQFIQKPVYAALGLLGKLGQRATDLESINMDRKHSVQVLRTISGNGLYMATIFISPEQAGPQRTAFHHKYTLNMSIANESAFITELLVPQMTDPVVIWQHYGSPAYPNATVREAMRRVQMPRLHETGPIWQYNSELVLNSEQIPLPWAMLLRVCSAAWPKLKRPKQLNIIGITTNEIMLTWREQLKSTQCLKTYQVWFRHRLGENWEFISEGWHLPFPSFQYAPSTDTVNGFYKVRGVDVFNEMGPFSQIFEYLEI